MKLKKPDPQEWTQRAKPEKGNRRTRRIALIFPQATADRLFLLARLDGVSVNHELETMTEAEYARRLADPAARAAIRAIAKKPEAEE